MINFEEFYFIKAFSKREYMDQFNTGELIRFSSLEYFHKFGNSFQRDFEGGIFQQPESEKGMLVFSKDKKTLNQIVDNYKRKSFSPSDEIIPTTGLTFFINGYICCFSVIPKKELVINEKSLVFATNTSAQKDFFHFLNGYSEPDGFACFSIYDAKNLVSTLYNGLVNKGYSVCHGIVDYKPITMEERINTYQNRDIQNIVFIKDNTYSYQKEYRFYVNMKECSQDHLDVDGIVLQDSLICNGEYRTNPFTEIDSECGL